MHNVKTLLLIYIFFSLNLDSIAKINSYSLAPFCYLSILGPISKPPILNEMEKECSVQRKSYINSTLKLVFMLRGEGAGEKNIFWSEYPKLFNRDLIEKEKGQLGIEI